MSDSVTIRALQPSDSIAEITALLHRAYAKNAEMGMRFVASHQSESVTADRLSRGLSFVAIHAGQIVGTITLSYPVVFEPDQYEPSGTLASFGQFAVDPSLQGLGIGQKLLDQVEAEACLLGAEEICLDTSEHAEHLIRYYQGRGYAVVGQADWRPEVNYKSVIMAKPLPRSAGSERSS